jgi:hypothetical protein
VERFACVPADPPRLRPHRRPHLVPVPRLRQRPHAPDPLLQRPPRRPRRRPRTHRPLRRTPSPATKSVIAVKLLHTVDDKQFRGATMRIEFPGRPNPSTCAPSSSRRRTLVPSLAPGDASKIATLAEAIEAVDLKPSTPPISPPSTPRSPPRQSKLEALRPSSSKPPSTSPATPTSTPPGSGPGPKPSTSSSAPSAPPCS